MAITKPRPNSWNNARYGVTCGFRRSMLDGACLSRLRGFRLANSVAGFVGAVGDGCEPLGGQVNRDVVCA
jgi:hypothetical protein